MNRTIFFRITGAAIVISIWILSLLPENVVPEVSGSDKLHHLLAYFACMFCCGQLYVSPVRRLKLAIAFVGMGMLIECIQYFTPTRSFELMDMVANALGVIAGWILVTIQFSVQRRLLGGRQPSPPASPDQ